MVPYCVVLRVLRQEGRCELQRIVGEVFGSDLGSVRTCAMLQGNTRAYPVDDIDLYGLVLVDLVSDFFSRLVAAIMRGARDAGDAVLFAAHKSVRLLSKHMMPRRCFASLDSLRWPLPSDPACDG